MIERVWTRSSLARPQTTTRSLLTEAGHSLPRGSKGTHLLSILHAGFDERRHVRSTDSHLSVSIALSRSVVRGVLSSGRIEFPCRSTPIASHAYHLSEHLFICHSVAFHFLCPIYLLSLTEG
jgi:hypothetical protein